MSKARFQEARGLIQAKRYDEARMILRDIDHPTAGEWLNKLATIAPEVKQSVRAKPKSRTPAQQQTEAWWHSDATFYPVAGILVTVLIIIIGVVAAGGLGSEEAANDVVAPEGWERIEGDDVALWLPPNWFGSSMRRDDIEALRGEMAALDPQFVQVFDDMLAQSPADINLLAFDSESLETNVNIVLLDGMPSNIGPEDYITEAPDVFPPQLRLDGSGIIELDGVEYGWLTIELDAFGETLREIQYFRKIGRRRGAIITYTTLRGDFNRRLPTFEQSVRTLEF